jgi:hypothetical protein
MECAASTFSARSTLRSVAVVLLLLGVANPIGVETAQAQAFGRVQETESNVSYFYHARPGEATVQVSLWGTVPRPGIYEVPDTTDLDKLLTMAGGAPMEARQENREAPTITVRVYRPEAGKRSKIFERRLENMLTGDTQYPALRDDDIVVVETVTPKQPFGWRDVLSVVSTLASLTLLGLRILTRV